MTEQDALKAIIARINGEWDAEELDGYPISVSVTNDVKFIAEQALKEQNRQDVFDYQDELEAEAGE